MVFFKVVYCFRDILGFYNYVYVFVKILKNNLYRDFVYIFDNLISMLVVLD